jgi:hypothetical protein
MDMRRYMSARYLKPADVEACPIRATITKVEEGKYEKPDITLDNGNKLSINGTNVGTLVAAYGEKDTDWIGQKIELYLGELKVKGAMQAAILVRPISPPIEKPAEPVPALNDEIPF